MNITKNHFKEIGKLGGAASWSKLTDEQKKKRLARMRKGKEKRRKIINELLKNNV